MAISPLPAGPFPVRVVQPVAIGSADQVMIDVDGFRFGTTTETGRIEWFFTLPFSEITELEYKATGGRVSGMLQDGTELAFRIDQVLAGEEAMRAVEALFGSETGSSAQSVDEATPGDGGASALALEAYEGAFASAAECDAGSQVRRFAQLTVGAGFEVRWNGRSLAARVPGTEKDTFVVFWHPKSRFGVAVLHTGAFGASESEALGALPKTTVVRKMDVVETDRFLDALAVLFAAHPVEAVPGHPNVREIVKRSEDPAPGFPLDRRVRRVPILSDEELAEALEVLEKRFDNAAKYGVEPQARRFAELTAAADLEVRWNGRGLDAVWRRTQKPIFFLTWDDRGVKGGLGIDRGNTEFGSWSGVRAEEAFDWKPNRRGASVDAAPGMEYTRKMDAAETNRTTDSFLDWLQGFLASHSVPSREAEAIWQTEDRLAYRGCGAVFLALSSIIWIGIIMFLLNLLPGGFPWGGPIGWAIVGLLFLVVPVTAIVKGVAARREIRDYNRDNPDATRFDTMYAWGAIILAVLIVVYTLTIFLLRVT